jgi:hypothetical protein
MVGARRFELRTSCAQGRRATRLRYAPTGDALLILKTSQHSSQPSVLFRLRLCENCAGSPFIKSWRRTFRAGCLPGNVQTEAGDEKQTKQDRMS